MVLAGINIEVISDFACPWCFIGKRRLQQAIAQRPDLNISVTWLPYQLNHDMPREGRNRREYYLQKFGAKGATDLRRKLTEAGVEEGIAFCDEQDAIAPNTLSAHVLMRWAQQDSTVDVNLLSDKLLQAHHIDCENIGDQDVLVRVAEECGMTAENVSEKLRTGDDEDVVKESIQQSAARGVSGVPFFILNNEHGISGAQPAEALVEIFDQIMASQP